MPPMITETVSGIHGMQAGKNFVDWAIRRMQRNNPERLWIHYGLALCLILGLIIASYLTNRAAVEQGIVDTSTINLSAHQGMLSQRILFLAGSLPASGDEGLEELASAIELFEDSHQLLIADSAVSEQLWAHYFSGPNPLDPKVREFISLAQKISHPPSVSQAMTLWQMSDISRANLLSSLEQAVIYIQENALEKTTQLKAMQNRLLAISILALMLVTLFIFAPAQLTVGGAIQQLRRKTSILKASQQQLRKVNDRLHYIAHHDALTGLPNRESFSAHLADTLRHCANPDFSLLFIDLDHFKSINDTAGHAIGDGLLVAVTDLLRKCIDEDDFVARMGGDEFILITAEPPETLAKRVQNTLAAPIVVSGRSCQTGASIGYTSADSNDNDPLQLVANADIALHAAKASGRSRIQAFTPDMRDAVESMQQLQSELPEAIESGQIEPWFQPQIALANGSLHGAEVLARWRHPIHGLLGPDQFIPIAERAGLTINMDHAIWRAAIGHADNWQKTGLWQPCISLNAAPDTIADPHLIERFLGQIQRTSLAPSQVVIEVLETTLIDGSDDMAAINIDSLAECGIALELDDFGTGYASLSKLTQLPLAGIKLDRSLIAPLPEPGPDSVVRAILALASELGLQVIAEGVETDEQAQLLKVRGCPLAQGYGFARPMPAADFTMWLQKYAKTAIFADDDCAGLPMRA